MNDKKIWLIFAIIFLLAAVTSGGIWLREYLVQKKAQEERDALAAQVNDTQPDVIVLEDITSVSEPEPDRSWEDYSLEEKYQAYSDAYGIEVPEKYPDFTELQENTNEDIYAWIYVPGTNIDDPVVQHPTDDSYYLNYNLDGSYGYPGGIYTESCNRKDFTDRMTVIYGHNMINDTGFGSLHDFESKEFFDENRYIFIYLPDDIMVYEIFAAYEGSNNHIIYGHNWDDESWVQYLDDTLLLTGDNDQALGAYEFEADDRVVTLATCIRNAPNRRYLVQGVLLDEVR